MPLFRRMPFVVHARRVREEERVQVFGRDFVAKPGDWILGKANERQSVCNDKLFRELYEPVDDEARKELEVDLNPGGRG